MNIPPKYEDVVFQLNELNKREAALREELDSIKASVEGYESPEHAAQVADTLGHANDALQQRLTVAEQRESLLKDLLTNAYIAINTMEPGFYLLEKIDAALKPAEVREGK